MSADLDITGEKESKIIVMVNLPLMLVFSWRCKVNPGYFSIFVWSTSQWTSDWADGRFLSGVVLVAGDAGSVVSEHAPFSAS